MIAVSFSPSAASTSSNTARAAGKASARALPMPTEWEPCPGNVNAAVIGAPSFEWGRKTLTKAGMSSRGAESPGLAQAPDRSIEAARLLVAANLFPGPGAACAAHDVARPVLIVWPHSRQPQHGGVIGLHFHAIRIPAFTEYAVDTRQVVAGHVKQQVMLEVVVDVIGCDEQPLEKIRVRGAGVAQGIAGVGNDC